MDCLHLSRGELVFFLSLLQLSQILPKCNLLPLIQNKLRETVHSWISFCSILSVLSSQHHTGTGQLLVLPSSDLKNHQVDRWKRSSWGANWFLR